MSEISAHARFPSLCFRFTFTTERICFFKCQSLFLALFYIFMCEACVVTAVPGIKKKNVKFTEAKSLL